MPLCAGEIVGLWQFDEDSGEQTRSWSTFGRSAKGRVDYQEARVGKGAYSAVHGEETPKNWRHHATASIRLLNHARIDGDLEIGLAVWLKPIKSWSSEGRLISFRKNGLGIAEVPGKEGYFRIVNPGLVDEAKLPVLELPLGEWSHVALAADGREVYLLVNGELIARLPQTGALKADERLYLGAMDSGGVGLFSTYVDELVFYRGAADDKWAREIYDVTAAGTPLTVELPPLPEFEPVERDPSVFLRLSHEAVTIQAGAEVVLKVEARETPLFGGYLSPRLMTSKEDVLGVIDDLKAHHCNTIVVNAGWCRQRPELLRLFHEHDFRVFAIVSPPYGADLVREFPDVAQRAESGETLNAASFYDERMIRHVSETFLADGLNGRGVDGVILDEPSMPGYRRTLREGILFHANEADQDAYMRMFGEEMPVSNLSDNVDAAVRERIVTFRQRMMTDWLSLVEDVVATRASDVDYHVVLTPDNVLSRRRKTGLSSAEATAIDVEELLKSDILKGVQLTAYLNAWGERSPAWVEQFLPLFLEKAHEQGKASIIWAQAYLESPEQVARGIKPGEIGELIHRTVGAGADGMLLWHYRGFSQEGYRWQDFFDELSEAAEAHLDRPAEGLSFQTESPEVTVDVKELGDGEYALRIAGGSPGEYTLNVRNRSGVVQKMKINVE